MLKPVHLTQAPITEALIDLRANVPESTEEGAFLAIRDRLSETYPHFETRKLFEGTVSLREGEKPTQLIEDKGFHGLWLTSEDGRNIAQFRVDGFTVNRLKPYTSWRELNDQARQLWVLFVEHLSPISVPRVAVRYINHIRVPSPVQSLDELRAHIVSVPNVPEGLPSEPVAYFSRLVTRRPEGVRVNFIQRLEGTEDPKWSTLVIDIDAYRQCGTMAPDDQAIWDILEQLRVFKNEVFFSCITSATYERLR